MLTKIALRITSVKISRCFLHDQNYSCFNTYIANPIIKNGICSFQFLYFYNFMDNSITNVCNFLPKHSTYRRVCRRNKTCNHRKVVLDWNVNINHTLKISEGARVVNINLNRMVFSFSELLSWGYKSIDSSRNATKWHKTTSKVTTQISKYYRAY